MDSNPRRSRGRGRGLSVQNNLQGPPQRNTGPVRPQVPRLQQQVIRPQQQVIRPQQQIIRPQQQVIRPQPQPQPRPNESMPSRQTPNQSQGNSASLEVQQVIRGINNLRTENEHIPLGRGVIRGRRNVEFVKPVRPPSSIGSKEGTSGNPITLIANYFPITSYTNWTLYQYRVNFNPEEDSMVLKRGLVHVHHAKLSPYIFDGSMLFSSKKYESDKLELSSKRDHDGQIVLIEILFVRVVEINDHANIQVFNLLLRKCIRHLNLQLVGRHYYDAQARIEVNRHQLQIWPGYETTIGMFDNGLMLRAEISTKVMRQETVYQFFMECITDEDGFTKFKQGVIGTIVLTSYNNQTYRIHDVDDEANVNSTFLKRDGSRMSYVQYYREKWGLTVREPRQPMLISKKKKSVANDDEELIYLVPEFCSLTGLSDSMRTNFALMKDLAVFTQVNPRERVNRYNNFMHRLQNTPNCLDIFNTWNLRLGSGLVEFSGRTLPHEKIYPNAICGKTMDSGPQANWTSHLRDLPMFTCAQLQQWHVVYPINTSISDVRNFVSTLKLVSDKMGFILPMPNIVSADTNKGVQGYIKILNNICDQYNPPLILCVVTSTRTDFYIAIKKALCVTRAIPSQVVVAKNVSRCDKSVCTKVAIQINAKLGGAPWLISIPAKGMMIIGFDVCHDKRKSCSYGALIATMNDTHTSYYSTVQKHNSGEEISTHMGALVLAAVRKYQMKNKTLPNSIIVYRDGVGDGQLGYVQKTEVASIKKLYKENFAKPPALAYVIVKKRIATRFFTRNNHGLSNPPPGTVIDKIVTDPSMYDFYLVSQNSRFGTVTPTHYNVLEDTLTNWSPDRMQRLTFKLTHMYYNWSGTVRVPAPCQLAHKLAFLAAQVGVPNAGLDELLFYL